MGDHFRGNKELNDNQLINKVAKKIKTVREERKISQQAFYDETNIHIGRIESGKINISISTLGAICNHFGLSLKEFFEEFE
jgi:transcriptional regulator with XRE-family HTH domain